MNPELPYLRKTVLFGGESEAGLRGFEQVRGYCEKALKHFNFDQALLEASVWDLHTRLAVRSWSQIVAIWEAEWPKVKSSVANDFPEPPRDYSSANEFFNTVMARGMEGVAASASEMDEARYWLVQLIEERRSANPEEVPLDLKNPVSMLVHVIDLCKCLSIAAIPDPSYKNIVESTEPDISLLPIMQGIELMGGLEAVDRRESFGWLSLALGDFLNGARHKKDAFNGSHSLDDTSALMLLISDDLVCAINEPEPNIEDIFRLTERLKDVENNFMRLSREIPVIGAKSLDPLRSKAGGEKRPWHVDALQHEIDRLDPELSWKQVFRELSKLGSNVTHPDIESIDLEDDKLKIIPSDKKRNPKRISRETLSNSVYKLPKR